MIYFLIFILCILFLRMFSKAPIKRYNDEVNETPAPGDYDPKEAKSRGSKIAHSTSARFNEVSKSVTPGKFPSFKRPYWCSQFTVVHEGTKSQNQSL